MGKKDVLMLEILMENARLKKTELAKLLNVTEAAVRKRLKKLESSGIIVGYRAIVDYQRAGLMASITGVDTEPERLWSVVEELKGFEEIKEICLTSGDHMIMTEIVAKGVEELMEAHKRIEGIKGVKRVCPAIVLRRIK